MLLEKKYISISYLQGPPYFIFNGTEAPTTTTTTTTTTATTTVVTTSPTMKEWFTKPITQRPKRTTTPMPTEENPLLRFYPVEDDESNNDIPIQMMSDQGSTSNVGKHSERSSPMTDFFSESASNGNQILLSKPIAAVVFVFILILQRQLQ